ncbi:MAG TPA: hypothetical protein DCP75_10855 [Haliea salexigens]|uniref:DNA polymerase III subunit gamma/tau n=2 Tax=Haliea salexigens TaxID=287487 RepID=A0A3C1KNY8_9GAMM|nr:hypothetical protein [Haliea salexigens]
MAEHAPDFDSALAELLALLHRVAVAQMLPDHVDTSRGDAERVVGLAAALTAEDVQLFYQMALNGKRDLPHAADPRSGFEMTVLRMLAFRPALLPDDGSLPSVEGEPSASRPGTGGASAGAAASSVVGSVAAATQAQAPPPSPASIAPQMQRAAAQPEAPIPEPVVPQPPAPVASMQLDRSSSPALTTCAEWPDLLARLGLAGMVLSIASHCALEQQQGSEFRFVLDDNQLGLFNPGHAERIRLALQNYFDTPVSVSIEPGRPAGETPAMRLAREREERQREAEAAIESDVRVQQLIQRFDGELDRGSITPLDS